MNKLHTLHCFSKKTEEYRKNKEIINEIVKKYIQNRKFEQNVNGEMIYVENLEKMDCSKYSEEEKEEIYDDHIVLQLFFILFFELLLIF